MSSEYITQFLPIIGGLVLVTNIIVQVIKPFTSKYVNTNWVAFGVSMILTLVAFFAWCSHNSIAIVWYYVVGAVVLGFFVSYAAMFGFDKLKEAIEEAVKKND